MTLATLLFAALLQPATAAELAGVTLPDSTYLNGRPLVLNGMGLREKYFVDVYVGGLYLVARTSDLGVALRPDAPRRIHMHFVYSEVEAAKLVETYREGFSRSPLAGSLQSEIGTFLSWLVTVNQGDQMVLDYVPGKGTTLTIKGQVKGTIAGEPFMRLVFGTYFGPGADKQLRSGLLGL